MAVGSRRARDADFDTLDDAGTPRRRAKLGGAPPNVMTQEDNLSTTSAAAAAQLAPLCAESRSKLLAAAASECGALSPPCAQSAFSPPPTLPPRHVPPKVATALSSDDAADNALVSSLLASRSSVVLLDSWALDADALGGEERHELLLRMFLRLGLLKCGGNASSRSEPTLSPTCLARFTRLCERGYHPLPFHRFTQCVWVAGIRVRFVSLCALRSPLHKSALSLS